VLKYLANLSVVQGKFLSVYQAFQYIQLGN